VLPRKQDQRIPPFETCKGSGRRGSTAIVYSCRRFIAEEAFHVQHQAYDMDAGQVISEVKESLRDGDASLEGKNTRVWRVLK